MNVPTQDVLLSISAAGTTQGTATELISGITQVSTVASGAGVILFTSGIGVSQIVYNAGANPLKVYPPVGMTINNVGTNTAHLLAVNTACEYWTVSSTLIVASPQGQSLGDVGAGLSAAGTTQATATALTNAINGLTTVGAASGVILFAGGTGYTQSVYNGGANAVNVYPPTGAKINNIATNGAHILAINTACTYTFLSATQIFGVLSA